MTKENTYSDLVNQAEKAVQAVKDPELKRVAFEKILDDLLGGGTDSSAKKTQQKRRTKKRSSGNGKPQSAGPQAYVEEMIKDNFFTKPKTIAQVKAELGNRGHHIARTSLSGPLQKLTQKKKLRRQKVKTAGKKQIYSYSNW